MNPLLDETEDREDRRNHHRGSDREITLGTTMILLIFFALAVYGAVLFGFGYSLGSKHTGTSSAEVAATPTSSAASNVFKPAPGSPVGSPAPGKVAATADDFVAPIAPAPKSDATPAKATVDAATPDESAARPRTPPPTASPNSTAAPTPMPVAGVGSVVVQVAAVSHQEDADLIATSLKRRGYAVNIKAEADKLLHVQVGPFATRKDAEVMKARLLSDGFNAYIK